MRRLSLYRRVGTRRHEGVGFAVWVSHKIFKSTHVSRNKNFITRIIVLIKVILSILKIILENLCRWFKKNVPTGVPRKKHT